MILSRNSVNINQNCQNLFKRDITQWRTFWDSFNSAVHTNKFLTNIDKFNHLNSLLEGQAKRSIQGLALTEQNYQAAIDILQQRFGSQQLVISTRSHGRAPKNPGGMCW
jgi:hypothetical protein